MMNLKTFSIKPLIKIIPKWIIYTIIIVSIIGFLDATYLTAKHYLDAPIPCSVFQGCEKVTTSEYATVFGIPVALGGSLYYLVIFLLSVAYLDLKNSKFLALVPWISIVGFLSSVWFVYLQLFVIKAICPYCMLSALTSTILFILGMTILIREKS